MSVYALLDEKNYVINTVTVNSDEEESTVCRQLTEMHGGIWKKTDYTGQLRKNFGEIGSFYDEFRDAFIPPKPYDYMILNEDTCKWDYPIPYPNDGKDYIWVDAIRNWQEENSDMYSISGSYPSPLPNRIRLSDGSTRTDRSTFTPEEIADAGYVLVDEPPEINENQYILWNGVNWEVRDQSKS